MFAKARDYIRYNFDGLEIVTVVVGFLLVVTIVVVGVASGDTSTADGVKSACEWKYGWGWDMSTGKYSYGYRFVCG
jgi:hypothetical protein